MTKANTPSTIFTPVEILPEQAFIDRTLYVPIQFTSEGKHYAGWLGTVMNHEVTPINQAEYAKIMQYLSQHDDRMLANKIYFYKLQIDLLEQVEQAIENIEIPENAWIAQINQCKAVVAKMRHSLNGKLNEIQHG